MNFSDTLKYLHFPAGDVQVLFLFLNGGYFMLNLATNDLIKVLMSERRK